MVMPLPPSVVTNIDPTPTIPTLSSDARVFMVGVGNAATTRPTAYSSNGTDILNSVPANGVMANAVQTLLAGRLKQLSVALTAGSPSFGDTLEVMRQVRFLDERPTHLYVPAQTGPGRSVGALQANITDAVTQITLAAAHSGLSDGVLIQVEDEVMEIVDLPGTTTIDVVRGVAGTTAAAHSAGQTVSDLRNPLTAELEALAEELECLAVADAPNVDVEHAIAWSNAGNTRESVMGVYNYADGNAPGAYWLNTVIDVAGRYGHQRGIETAQVNGVTALAQELSYSPRGAQAADVTRLVGAYLSTLARREGSVQIFGDTFRGVTDARRIWSNALVVRRLERVTEIAGESFIGLESSPRNLRALAFHVENAARGLINSREIRSISVIPHPTRNTDATIQAGRTFLRSTVGLYHPIKFIVNDMSI